MNNLPVVLLAFANDYDPTRRLENLSSERDQIIRSLRKAEGNDLCQVEIIRDANFENVIDAFRDSRFKDRIAVFHFAGHADDYVLCLESLQGKPEYILAEGFAQFLGQQHNLKMVFLNGCATNDHAIHLHEEGVPIVISTKREVNDDLAAVMAINFYKSLASDNTILRSFKEAEGVIKSKNIDWSILTRGLGLRNRNGIVSDWKMSSNEDLHEASQWCFSLAKNDPFYGLPKLENSINPHGPFIGLNEYSPESRGVFWGRDQEIRKLYDKLDNIVTPSLVLCHGVKGVGKSSLLKAGVIPRLSMKYNVITLDIDNNLSIAEFKKHNLSSHLNDQPKETKTYIFIFGLKEINEAHLAEIINVNDDEDYDLCFVIETPNQLLQKLQDKFKVYATDEYNLRPLSKVSIDNIFLKLESNYPVEIDVKFQESLTSIILSDSSSAIAPVFQFILFELWEIAKEKNFEKPHLNLELLTEWNEKGGFISYINTQLAKFDTVYLSSGLVLEILNACAPSNYLSSIPDISNLNRSFNISYEELEKIIFQLKKSYLISEPVAPQRSSFSKIRLYHSILINPLKDIINDSYKPAQEVRRICNYNLREDKLFDRNQLKLVQDNWNFVKAFAKKETNILERSRNHFEILRNRKKAQRYLQFSISFVILVLGVFLNSPYLIMYLVLIFILYIF